MKSKAIQILAKSMLILWGIVFLSKHDLWAEPDPPKETAFTVAIAKAEPVVELEVEKLMDDMELLARLVEAESGNQSLLGRRMVVDVVLNRLDHDDFPDNLHDVIFQKNQFATADKLETVKASELSWEAVLMEQNERIDYDVIYFKTKGYPQYGEPVTQIEDHYFSK